MSGGRRVVLRLCVRKFFCRVPTCPRKVFTERLPDLVQPWARESNRLLEELKAVGLAASAQVQLDLPNGQMREEMELAGLTYAERKKKISRDKRSARYEQVLALHQAGMGQRAIARQMHMSRRIVRRFLTAETFPERAAGSGHRPKGKGKLDPYLAYLHERWNAGEQTSSHLFREIKERGYTGSESLLRRLLSEWRAELPPTPRKGPARKPRLVPPGAKKRRLSSRGASFLMILPSSKLSAVQQQQVEQMTHNEDLRLVSLHFSCRLSF